MEFNRRDALDGVDGLISEDSFARLLLMHAQVNSLACYKKNLIYRSLKRDRKL